MLFKLRSKRWEGASQGVEGGWLSVEGTAGTKIQRQERAYVLLGLRADHVAGVGKAPGSYQRVHGGESGLF